MTGIFMLGIESTKLTTSDIRRLSNPLVGGVLIFSRNYNNPDQLISLISSIKDVSEDLIIAVDQEGGRVQRLREAFTKLPAMRTLGLIYGEDPAASLQYIKDCATVIAYELGNVGIDFTFAPVLDLDRGSDAIGDRSFSGNPDVVAKLGSVFIDRLRHCGMLSVGKHFPGHGSTIGDTHTRKVCDNRELVQIMQTDLKPFEHLIKEGKLNAVMLSHIIYSNISEQPASLSKEWIWDILRKHLNFLGIVFSDDLGMVGAGEPQARGIINALSAGCDIMLICNSFEYMDYILKQVTCSQVTEYCKRTTEKYTRLRSGLLSVGAYCKEDYDTAVLNLSQLKI